MLFIHYSSTRDLGEVQNLLGESDIFSMQKKKITLGTSVLCTAMDYPIYEIHSVRFQKDLLYKC